MSKLLQVFSRRRTTRRTIHNCFLNGFYFVNKGKVEKMTLPLFFKHIYKMYNSFLVVRKRKRIMNLERGTLQFGTHKVCISDENRVASFYKEKDYFFKASSRICLYVDDFKLPSSKILFIDSKKRYLISERIVGIKDAPNDITHFEMVIDSLLNTSFLPKKFFVDNSNQNGSILFYVQHGDFHNDNIIFNDNSFVMIDFDELDLYPAFFDVFYYLSFFDYKIFNAFINRNSTPIKMNNILSFYHLKQMDNVVDFYLSCFVEHFSNKLDKHNLKGISQILSWTSNFDFSTLPLTKKSVDVYNQSCLRYKI